MRFRHLVFPAAILALALVSCAQSGGGSDGGSSDAAVSSFSFPNLDAVCTVDESQLKVAVGVRWNANLTALTPTIVHTGASISPASGLAQDFTNPVTYTVTAEDGTTKAYAVTVTHREFAVGDKGPAGGTIFYVNDFGDPFYDDWKYMEAAPSSTDVSREWGGNGVTIGTSHISIFEGWMNANAIVAALRGSETGKAAQYCDDLAYGSYDDWYLPDDNEFSAMDGAGLIEGNAQYWSSHEENSYRAYTYTGGSGMSRRTKSDSYLVRAVRAF